MAVQQIQMTVVLATGEEVAIAIVALSKQESLWQIADAEAKDFGEAPYQIVEGHSYEYNIDPVYVLAPIPKIVTHSHFHPSKGMIKPGNYVGTLSIDIQRADTGLTCGAIRLEVRSVKTDYRSEYRMMLEDITERCTELIMQHQIPVTQHFLTDPYQSTKALYQRFAFIKAVLASEELNSAVYKVGQSPVTSWKQEETEQDIRKIKRVTGKMFRQMASSPAGKPSKITAAYKVETVDTPENRFVKYALEQFAYCCTEVAARLQPQSRQRAEALVLSEKLSHYLSFPLWKEVARLQTVPLNSPILQRKAGYREILRAWLMFDLAAKLTWEGGEDVYEGGKRDVATLYEYWLFFKLTDIVAAVFHLQYPDLKHVIEATADGLNLKLKQGRFLVIEGVYENDMRKLQVQFSYNRTFTGKNPYPAAGSWSTTLRPDYTISIWPYGIAQEIAEKEELIVHIHFDAKYRIEGLQKIWNKEDDLDEEKKEQAAGTYKKGDLLKMHTYRDAIRRTAGAYVLYPGASHEFDQRVGFHEILPGLGAFAIRPARGEDDTKQLKAFLHEVAMHLLNSASQREKMACKLHEIHQMPPATAVHRALPEQYSANRMAHPDDITVLVGYYKSEAHLKWIIEKQLYNVRIENASGSIQLHPTTVGASYLLLYGKNNEQTSLLFKLDTRGPRIFSRQEMIKSAYPTRPTQPFYLVFSVEPTIEEVLKGVAYDMARLRRPSTAAKTAPFTVSFSELMRAAVPH